MKKRVLLSAHQMLYFMAFVSLSFNVLLMQSRGFSNTLIGIILAANSVVTIIMQPVWGFISDWIQSVRKVFILCSALAAITYYLLSFFSSSTAYMIIFPISTIFACVHMPLVNTTCLLSIEKDRSISYGSIRIWGSVGYAVMAFVIGRLFAGGFTVDILFPIYSIFTTLNLILAFFIEDSVPKIGKSSLKNMQFGALFKNYYFITCIIAIFVAYIPVVASLSYCINIFEKLGATAAVTGTIFGFRALADIPSLILSAPLIKRFGARRMLIFSLAFLTVIVFTLGIAKVLAVAVAASVMTGMAYCLLLTSSLNYVFELSPVPLRTTAQTILTTAQVGLAATAGNFFAGRMIDSIGASDALLYLSGLGVLGVLFLVATILYGKKRGIPETGFLKQADVA